MKGEPSDDNWYSTTSAAATSLTSAPAEAELRGELTFSSFGAISDLTAERRDLPLETTIVALMRPLSLLDASL